MEHYKIGRLVITKNEYVPDEILFNLGQKLNAKVDYLITPGGFVQECFSLPEISEFSLKFLENSDEFVKHLEIYEEETFNEVLSQLEFKKLIANKVKYFSLGVDIYFSVEEDEKSEQCYYIYRSELVLLYDVKKEKIINVTGKFYPTSSEQNEVIKMLDFDKKFLQIGDDKVLIFGCHDLNVFNPRGQANLREGSYKYKISQEFFKRFEQEKPNIILQHPHTTDTPNIWRAAWNTIRKKYPFVEHFASGIHYANYKGEPRGDLDEVLEVTKKGSVLDIIV